MKKVLVLLFTVSLIVILAACSSNNEPAATPAPTPEVQAPATEQEEKKEESPAPETTETTALNPDGAYNVVLVDSGSESLKVLSTIKNELNLDLAVAKSLVDEIPSVIAEQLSLADAEALKAAIEAEGAVIELQETEKVEVVATEGIVNKVVLIDGGAAKLNVVKEIKNHLELGLAESKDLVDNVPSILIENVTTEEAEALKAVLEAVGATVEFQ